MSTKENGYTLQDKDHGPGWTLRWWSVARGQGDWHTVRFTTFERVEGSTVEKPIETILYSGPIYNDARNTFIAQQSAQHAAPILQGDST